MSGSTPRTPAKTSGLPPASITGWLPPGGPGVRFDSHVYTGYEIPPFYDSLIGKLIVWGNDRDHALKRLRRALAECAVTGIPTTIEFHLQTAGAPGIHFNGDVHTKFVEQEMLPNELGRQHASSVHHHLGEQPLLTHQHSSRIEADQAPPRSPG